uniref:Histone-lysine N-methyltransferase, H3 lysine-79 specific n=1 Tax=Strongyloides papillosus TaxID=174720 RepID=A0A0N5CHL0_STREA
MISPANYSAHKIFLPLRIRNIEHLPFNSKVVVVSDISREIEIVGELGFDKLVVKPFYQMVVARCCQFMAFEGTPAFRKYCSDTSERYKDEIEKYTSYLFNDLSYHDTLLEVVKFIGSIIRYRDEVRRYFACTFGNVYPEPSEAPRAKMMSESQSTELFNWFKECFAGQKRLQRYYHAGSEYVYGELNPHAFFQLNSEERTLNENFNFFDCGAGIFNIVAMVAATKISNRSIGIELNPGVGCPGALLLLGFYHVARFGNYYFNATSHILGDFNNSALEPLLYSRPSMIVVNNYVLSASTMDPFFKKLARNQKSTVRFILTKEPSFYRRLPAIKNDDSDKKGDKNSRKTKYDLLTISNFTKKVITHIDRAGSWTDNTVTIYYYYR